MGKCLASRPFIVLLLAGFVALPIGASDKISVEPPAQTRLKLSVGRQTLLRSPAAVRRTAVADPNVCRVNQFSASELAIVARSAGTTDVIFWLSDPNRAPVVYTVEVE